MVEQTDFSGSSMIDPETDPAGATQAAEQALAEAQEEQRPEAPLPPEDEVELPNGYLTGDGSLLKKARVQEVTGAVEEALARPNLRRNPPKYVTTLLNHTVAEIGGQEPTDDMLQNLLIGDRETLVLAVRKLTLGHTMDIGLSCPFCRREFEVEYDLDKDVPFDYPEDPKKRRFEVTLKKGIVEVVLPTGAVQETAHSSSAESQAERTTVTLGECLVTHNGQPIVNRRQFARSLNIVDRRTLLEFFYDNQAGPRYEKVTQECPGCLREFPLVIGIQDLFHF